MLLNSWASQPREVYHILTVVTNLMLINSQPQITPLTILSGFDDKQELVSMLESCTTRIMAIERPFVRVRTTSWFVECNALTENFIDNEVCRWTAIEWLGISATWFVLHRFSFCFDSELTVCSLGPNKHVSQPGAARESCSTL